MSYGETDRTAQASKGRAQTTVDIAFCDDGYWAQNFILTHLSAICAPRVVPQHEWHTGSVDIVFIGDGKNGQRRAFPNAKHVLVTTEDLYPDFSSFDYVIAYQYLEHPRYLRMPNWAILAPPEDLIKNDQFSEVVLQEAREFCAFVQSNGNPRRTKRRLDFFTALSERRFVHSGGRVRNNIGYTVQSLSEFLRGFQFVICFENNASPGYTTEKVLNAILSGCIPIYWGDPEFHRDINPDCVILVDSFKNDEAALKHILEVADNVELRKKYLDAPFFHGNRIPPLLSNHRIQEFLGRIMDNPRPVRSVFSLRHRLFGWRKKLAPYLPTFGG
jgi:hypothetical protein